MGERRKNKKKVPRSNVFRQQQHLLSTMAASAAESSSSSLSSSSAIRPSNNDNDAQRQHQKQKQLHRREAMQLFLESLRLVVAELATTTTTTPTTTMARTTVSSAAAAATVARQQQRRNRMQQVLGENWKVQQQQQERQLEATQQQPQSWRDEPAATITTVENSAIVQSTVAAAATATTTDENSFAVQFPQKDLVTQLHQAIKQRQPNVALKLFEEVVYKEEEDDDDNFVLSSKMTSDLFFLLSQRHQVAAYRVLQYYNYHHYHHDSSTATTSSSSSRRMPMYKRICNSISNLEFGQGGQKDGASKDDVYQFVLSMVRDIEGMIPEEQQVLYPMLIVSLVTQRRVFLGRFAHRAYDAMVDGGLEMEFGWLVKMLSCSKYNRQDDLPYHDILARLVDMGGTPHSSIVMPVIHNMFPYTDSEKMHVALQALVDLETTRKSNNGRWYHHQTMRSFPRDTFRIDMSTLEMISHSAAKVGDAALILLVWDLLDMSGYEPTETIFENTILAFASQPDGLHRAFVALASMREHGLEPTRPLIRSFSYLIRPDPSIIDDGLELLLQNRGDGDIGKLLSLDSLNVIMASYAERGDVEQALEMLKIMEENGIKANKDSYSFAIEVLGKSIHRRSLEGDFLDIQSNLEIADLILTRMEKDGVEPSSFLIRQYVELLCQTGDVDTATSVVESCSSPTDRGGNGIVCNKSIYRVALANAEMGNYEKARELAGMMSEEVPILHRKIRSKEQRYQHVEFTKRLRENEDGVSAEEAGVNQR